MNERKHCGREMNGGRSKALWRSFLDFLGLGFLARKGADVCLYDACVACGAVEVVVLSEEDVYRCEKCGHIGGYGLQGILLARLADPGELDATGSDAEVKAILGILEARRLLFSADGALEASIHKVPFGFSWGVSIHLGGRTEDASTNVLSYVDIETAERLVLEAGALLRGLSARCDYELIGLPAPELEIFDGSIHQRLAMIIGRNVRDRYTEGRVLAARAKVAAWIVALERTAVSVVARRTGKRVWGSGPYT